MIKHAKAAHLETIAGDIARGLRTFGSEDSIVESKKLADIAMYLRSYSETELTGNDATDLLTALASIVNR